MNPSRLNHRITFTQLTTETNEFGGATPIRVELLTTWGSLEPIKQYQQWALEGGASVLNGDKILIIRYRDGFQPDKDMLFTDGENGDEYTVHSIHPYYEKSGKQKIYKDREFVMLLGVKRS